jgi:signal peptidase I
MSFQSILSNFALILFALMIITGVIWVLDTFIWAKARRLAASNALSEFDARNAKLIAEGVKVQEGGRAEIEECLLRQPTWVEYTGSFFPVIALVFVLRSFLFEPFKIPSESMLPTLHIGDLILVNKFTYGVRLPIINKKIIDINDPKRGDVMVFKYPKDVSLDYIKRVVGVPGDKVTYRNKRLSINGEEIAYAELPDFSNRERNLSIYKQFSENLTGVNHSVLNDDFKPSYVTNPDDFPFRNNCSYDDLGFTCVVPKGHYFMMGDNRDNSADSRYWGFVSDENIVGKAFFVWMNFSNFSRIGNFQ